MSFTYPAGTRALFALFASSALYFAAQTSHAQTCPFDDGNSSLAVEGVILTRYALGITGAPLVASTGIAAVDAPTVEAAITCPSCGLNITGNPTMTVADATIISRKLAGFSGDALTNGLALGSGTRNTPAAVQSFLLAGCGATGGTVTSITAGSGLTGGTITGSGTIAVNPAVVQSRVSASCAVGSSIRVIAADGTVTCQVDNGGSGGGGTVSSVATGAGLTGGPVTTSGTIGLATTQLLPTTACANNQIPKWNGTAWLCATDSAGGSGTVTNIVTSLGIIGGPLTTTGSLAIAPSYRLPQTCLNGQLPKYNTTTQLWECAADNGGGTVTSVGAGIGINGGPVTTSGTLSVAPSFRLPQTCSNGQFTRFNNTLSIWECVTPSVVTSVATGPGLTGGPITATGTVSLATTQLLPTTACATDQIIKWNGTAWACASETAASTAWTQGGNAFGVPGVIGTTDTQELKIVAGSGGTSGRLLAYLGSSSNGMHLVNTSSLGPKPNTISVTVGSASNSFGFLGATVSGGGYGDINCYDVVTALTNKSCGNSATDEFAVVAGGFGNRVSKPQGTVSGGNENTTEETGDTVGGGSRNRAWGPNATVSGGRNNQATFTDSTVSGGALNIADARGSTVLGGVNNQATRQAQYGIALGRGAVARNYGQYAHASNGEGTASPFAPGNAQYSRMVLSSTGSGLNTNFGARPLTAGSPDVYEQMRFLPKQSAFVDATVIAKEPGTTNAMAFTIKCIVMVDSLGAMTLSPSPCVPAVQQQTSALPWTMTTATSAVGGGAGTIFTIRQNSPVGIKWVATVNVTELLE
jgi:hypothetical protein